MESRNRKTLNCDGNNFETSKDTTTHDKGQNEVPRVEFTENPLKTLTQTAHVQAGNIPTETKTQPGFPDHVRTNLSKPNLKTKWTKEQYKELMWAFYCARERKDRKVTEATYDIWRTRNPDLFPHIGATTLSNQRRFVEREHKLTDLELDSILLDVKKTLNLIRTENLQPPSNEPIKTENLQPSSNELIQTENLQLSSSEPILATDKNDEFVKMETKIITKLIQIKMCKINERNQLNKVKETKFIKEEIEIANTVLTKLTKNLNITELNELLYATAAVIAGEKKPKTILKQNNQEPAWQMRIKKNIEWLRKDLAVLNELKKENVSHKTEFKARRILEKYKLNEEQIEELQFNIQMKIQAKAQRLRRFIKRSSYFHQNKLFYNNQHKFYNQINNQSIEILEPPTQDEIEHFWQGIVSNDVNHNEKASWIEKEKKTFAGIKNDKWEDFSEKEITEIIKQTHNWKSPGPDQLQNFWLKHFTAAHQALTKSFNEVIENSETAPEWLTTGVTFLIPKNKFTKEAKNYRPITCLPTMYKILTAAITNRMYLHLMQNNIFPCEQKGCKKKTKGCKDNLLINKLIVWQAKKQKKNLSMAWIDYKKAFDSVPHSWILETLKIYKINPVIIHFVTNTMKKWQTEMLLFFKKGHLKTKKIAVKRGIFQGDSLSPLLFCLTLIPLTNILNSHNLGFKIDKTKINHLFYMDDLKLFSNNDSQLNDALALVKTFSNDIRMEFGLEKCSKVTIRHGKLQSNQNIKLDNDAIIKNLEPNETYKYLGVEEHDGIQHSLMKEKIKKEYYRRVRQILKTELNSKNKFTAINSLAVPILTYSFGIINWLRSEIEKMNRKTRKLLTIGGVHHPKADVERLYIKRCDGGRGLIDLVSAYNHAIVDLSDYIQTEPDKITKIAKFLDHQATKYSIQKEAAKIKNKYSISNPSSDNNKKNQLKNQLLLEKINNLKIKPLHGQFFRNLDNPTTDKEQTMSWLKSSGLKGETESLIIAAQDQALNTRYFQKHILKQDVDSRCRLCNKAEEHISHIVSGCTILAPTEYTKRHNNVANYIHWKLCKHFGAKTSEKYYQHQPEKVVNVDDVTITWDLPVITDRTIPANRPDIVVHNRKNKECLLVEVSVPEDANIVVKEAEKMCKYKDLEIEISRMWNAKTRVIPVVIGALGTIRKGIQDKLMMIPGKPNVMEIQKIALMGTAHILRRVLG